MPVHNSGLPKYRITVPVDIILLLLAEQCIIKVPLVYRMTVETELCADHNSGLTDVHIDSGLTVILVKKVHNLGLPDVQNDS